MDMSIDEGLFVTIGGIDQWLTIRGRDANNPVLLLISGFGAAFSPMARFFAPWEREFTLVQWDQPGAGATQAKNGDVGTGPLSIDRLARNGLAVAEFVSRRMHTEKISVLGISGGSIVALTMAQRRPALFFAYVGTGQIVDWARQEALSYALVLARARASGDAAASAELESIGAPPYADVATDAIKAKYANALTPAEQTAVAALMDPANAPTADARYVPTGLAAQDARAVALAAYSKMRNEIVAFDARRLGLDFAVPMFFFQGDHDVHTVTSEVEAYAGEVRAPQKAFALIEGGGHSAVFMRDEFLRLLMRYVQPLAPPAR
jgi:pimeloyl-ACP methyl ester carboxylesterase